jgi:hypothetical protein
VLETNESIESMYQIRFNLLKNDLKNKFILEEKNKKRIIFIFNKLYKLSTCMMCSGFWVGLFLVLLLSIFNINVFGMSINIIQYNGILQWSISSFLLSCLFSGTSWFLGVISTYFGNGETPSATIHNYHHKDME